MQTYLTVTYIDNKNDKKAITKESYEENFKKAKTIKIQIYLKHQIYLNPISIKITKKEEKKSYKIFITIGIIAFACILCGIIVYFISRKAAENTRRRQELYLRMARQRRQLEQLNRINPVSSADPSSTENEVSIHEINTQKIEKLLETTLAPINYNKFLGVKDGNPCTVCTICIEEFIVGKSKVCVTPCQHVFHFKCLKEWLMNNVLNPKCPNCNFNLLPEDKNEMLCSQGINDIPELTVNVMRSTDRLATNLEGRVTYNQHNNSINMETNGPDTAENRFINRNTLTRNQNSCLVSASMSNINMNKTGNLEKSKSKAEIGYKDDDEIDEVVIENIDNNDITN
jgi:hypothetical protein